jgi:hypothetical protein
MTLIVIVLAVMVLLLVDGRPEAVELGRSCTQNVDPRNPDGA